ncbi:MAG: T9SS type A sorting domain-containing protein [Saprospiraceae bacterium]
MKHFFTLALACLSLAIYIPESRAQGTFTETIQLACGDTAVIGNLGFPTWNDPHIIQPPRWGYAVLLGDFVPPNILEYQAPPCFTGSDTVIIECAHATQVTCDTGIYIFEISCNNPAPDYTITNTVQCEDSIYVDNLNGFQGPQITSGPDHGQAQIIFEPTDGAGVLYIPQPGFEGLDWVKVSTISGETYLYIFQVSCTATSTHEKTIHPLDIYPNPASSSIQVRGLTNVKQVRCYDLAGREFTPMYDSNTDSHRVDISSFPAGFYILKAYTSEGQHVGRFVKN